MSRLSALSPTALQAMFGQETDKELILLLTKFHKVLKAVHLDLRKT